MNKHLNTIVVFVSFIIGSTTILPIASFTADESGGLPIKVLNAPQSLTIEDALEPNNRIWNQAGVQAIKLNRTPPIYANIQLDDGEVPQAGVQLIRLQDDTVLVRIEWVDSSVDQFIGGKAYPNSGDQHIYKIHTENTSMFGDAACVMVPDQRGAHARYPTMMMGDVNSPTSMYYWQAGRGFSTLQAHGRETTAPTGQIQKANAVRDGTKWVVIQAIPNLVAQTPICFALWNGAKDHRDGMKYFSLWYEVQ